MTGFPCRTRLETTRAARTHSPREFVSFSRLQRPRIVVARNKGVDALFGEQAVKQVAGIDVELVHLQLAETEAFPFVSSRGAILELEMG